MSVPPVPTEPSTESLRHTAARLRHQGTEIARVMADLDAHDRPDVWRGARARAFGRALHHERRRMTGLGGTASTLDLLAEALDRRAAGLELDARIPNGLGGWTTTSLPQGPRAPDSP